MDPSYQERLAQQVDQYRDADEMPSLPSIAEVWIQDYVRPGMEHVFGTVDMNLFYADAFAVAAARSQGAPRFLSLGCGDGATEIKVAEHLRQRGMTGFTFVCADLSDVLLDRFRATIPGDLASHFQTVAGDLNVTVPGSAYDAIMANESLHHIADLESVYATAWNCLAPHGILATVDMIGRNGHMRWPETRLFLDLMWPLLTRHQRTNTLLRREEMLFLDHDCSTFGFEGIRAQEVLPLLLAQDFKPARFFGYGGMIDPIIDQCFGPNFDPASADDRFLVHRMGWLNEVLLDAGLIKPTMMMAWFEKSPVMERCYRGRTAAAAVRDVAASPPWLANALADLALHPEDAAHIFRDHPRDAE